MSRQVWKIQTVLTSEAELPVGAKLVHHGVQDDQPTSWFEVDTEAPYEVRRFAAFGTGHTIPDGYHHIGTTLHNGGLLVLHVYELIRERP
jgi:hypothetical protein